ncbi:hypothetical protein IXC47_19245 [Herminiimonas contaminans]|uniref:Uncharacterized protein n=2 Tax=Herminiimonas contaminans TaxID=1111140 RepID=A0ABS0EY92_9BURK|nr:hypothetical protein [Herminiimonas contaminans]
MGGLPNEGELLFFKNFIHTHWKEKDFYKVSVDLDLSGIEIEELQVTFSELYEKYLPKQAKRNGKHGALEQEDADAEREDEIELKLSFVDFLDFMIALRNRYFHFLQGTWQENLKTRQIVFPDLFFKPLVAPGINWVAQAMFEVVSFDVDNHL